MAEVEVRALGPDDVDDMVDLDEQSGYEVYDEYADFVEDEDEENSSLWGVFADDEKVASIDVSFTADQLRKGIRLRKGKKVYHKAILA